MYQFNHHKAPIDWARSLVILINYFVIYLYVAPKIMIWIVVTFQLSYDLLIYMELVANILLFAVTYLLARPLFAESAYNGVDNRRNNLSFAISSLFWMYLLMFAFNIIINLLTRHTTSVNQEEIVTLFGSYPLITAIMAVLLAPPIEEIVFRGVIFRKLRDFGYLPAQLVSSFLFGFAHVYSSLSTGNYGDLLFIFTYAMLGYFLALNYERSGSIYTSIGLHMAVNAISTLMIVLAGLAGSSL